MLVFVNRKSGGGQGAELQFRLSQFLNTRQVVDLMATGPLSLLMQFRKVLHATFGLFFYSIPQASFNAQLTHPLHFVTVSTPHPPSFPISISQRPFPTGPRVSGAGCGRRRVGGLGAQLDRGHAAIPRVPIPSRRCAPRRHWQRPRASARVGRGVLRRAPGADSDESDSSATHQAGPLEDLF